MKDKNDVLPLEERHPDLGWALRRFQLQLDALREMLNEMVPKLHELDSKRLGPDALAAIHSLPPEKQEALSAYIEKQFEEARAGEPLQTDAPVEPDGHREGPDPKELGFTEVEFKANELFAIFGEDRHYFGTFIEGLGRALSGPRRVTILHNSLLAMAIGAFEVLVSGVVTQYFLKHRDALENSERVFSLEDLRQFETVDDAADALLSRRVSDLMYGSVDDWAKWFAARCDVSFADLSMDWETVRESFQRRHIVMHNGGRVSSQYLAQLGKQTPAVGTRLPVDEDYVNGVLDQLDALGTGLALLAWGTWRPDERDQTAAELLKRSYDLMLLDRWAPVEKLSSLGDRLKCRGVIKFSIQCNGWLSRAQLYGTDSIESEVSDWDTSALAGRFQLVRLLLLDQLDDAMGLVPSLLETKEVTWGELQEWPILRKLREHPNFGSLAPVPSKGANVVDTGSDGPLASSHKELSPPEGEENGTKPA